MGDLRACDGRDDGGRGGNGGYGNHGCEEKAETEAILHGVRPKNGGKGRGMAGLSRHFTVE